MSVIALLKEIKELGIQLWVSPEGGLGFKAPKGAMTPALAESVKANRAAILDFFKDGTGSAPSSQAAPKDSAPRMSAEQKRLFFIEALIPGSLIYHLPGAVALEGPLDVDALEQAFVLLIERHEGLRTCFLASHGEPYPVIADRCQWEMARVNAEGLSESQMRDRARMFLSQPFDLADAPLLRAMVLRLTAERHILLWDMHHIISDDWSTQIFLQELAQAYTALEKGATPHLPNLSHQYRDYAWWQDQTGWDLQWWGAYLASVPQLRLPTDLPRPSVETFRGGHQVIQWNRHIAAGAADMARRVGGSPFMLYLTAFSLVFQRLTGQDDFVVGTTFGNRNQPEWERVLGLFINTLPLRVKLSGRSLEEILRQTRAMCLDAYAHGSVPFDQIVSHLQCPRDPSRHPLFQVLFTYTNTPKAQLNLGDLRMQPLDWGHQGVARMDLTITLDDSGEGVTGHMEYNSDLFLPQTIRRLVERVERVLTQIISEPSLPPDRLQILSQEEWIDLTTIARGASDLEDPPDMVHAFRQGAAKHPERLALLSRETSLTYGACFTEVQRMAAQLQHRGIRPGDRVGLYLSRQPHLPLAIQAVLAVGAIYVPLDPHWPAGRLAMVCEDAAPQLILLDHATRARWTADLPTLAVDQAFKKLEFSPVRIQPQSAAYIIFTSGSTGRPKGVAVSQGSLAAFLAWGGTTFNRDELAGVFAGTSATFDVSVCELLVPLGYGGTLILGENALDLITHPHRDLVRMFNTVPSAMAELVDQNAIPEGVLRVNLAGEALSAKLLRDILDKTHLRRVFNLYGPTEDTVYATVAQLEAATTLDPVLGKPMPGKDAWVLDSRFRPLPLGVPGELHLGGCGLALGYWGKPALTAQRFVPHPFPRRSGQRLYKTGDLVRRDFDGGLHFLGRLDHQVKINGYRIELGEVIYQLRALPGVREAEAIAREISGQMRLIGFVCLVEADSEPRFLDDLQLPLRKQLPAYMVPDLLVSLPALPLNPNGKIDKTALMSIALPTRSGSTAQRPLETPTQRILAGVWAQALGVAPTSRDAHFFQMGGHSLAAGRAAARIRTLMRVELPLHEFFEAPILEEMAARIDRVLTPIGEEDDEPSQDQHDNNRHTEVIASASLSAQKVRRTLAQDLAPSAQARPAHLPLSFSQLRLWLIVQMGTMRDAYHIPLIMELTGPLLLRQLEHALFTLVDRHEALRTVFPTYDDQPFQLIQPTPKDILTVVTLQPQEIDKEPWLEVFQQPFSLERGPLYRFSLFQLSGEHHVLAVCLHHLVADGWSLSLLFRELATVYGSSESDARMPAFLPYVDFALWQRQTYTEGRMEADLAWWRAYLAGLPEALHLPADQPRSQVEERRCETLPFTLPRPLSYALAQFADDQDTTLFVVLLSAFALVLHRFSGQDDLAVGSPIAGRRFENMEHTIGCFINNLVVRSHIADQVTYLDYLRTVREGVLGAFAHQDLPFEKLVEHLVGVRNTASSPLFQVLFNLISFESGHLDLGALSVKTSTPPARRAQYELSLTALVGDREIQGDLAYNADLFLPQTAQFLLRQWQACLQAIVENPTRSLYSLFSLASREVGALDNLFDRRGSSGSRSFAELLAQHARSRPNYPALIQEDLTISYGQLAVAVHRFSLALRDMGVKPGSLVGLFLKPDASLVVAVLAVQSLGAAYVPLDPGFPEERLAYMLHDSGCTLLLGNQLPSWKPNDLPFWVPQLNLGEATTAWEVRSIPYEALAYAVYTSGTTGRPKGIAIPNRALWNMAQATAHAYGLNHQDRVLQFAAMGFDVFAEEVGSTLAVGATLVLRPQQGFTTLQGFDRHIRQHRVSVVNLAVSWWAEWLLALTEGTIAIPETLRVVVVGSEAVPRDKLDQWRKIAPHLFLFNAYGPSETCVTATVWSDNAGRSRCGGTTAPIGEPIAGLSVAVNDGWGQRCTPGFTGELTIGGSGLAWGYLNRPALTAAAFVPDPDSHGERRYKTGDMVRHLPDKPSRPGALEFIGRRDTQVKIRGFRIELGEIEAVLRQHSAVEQVLVVAKTIEGEKRLVAYLVKSAQQEDLPAATQFAQVLSKLPAYMRPHQFVWLDRLPLSPTGKLDHKKLINDATESAVTSAHQASAPHPYLAQVHTLWEEALARPVPTAEADFFELGGNSLGAVRLLGKLNRTFQTQLTLAHFMNAASPFKMAELLTQRQNTPRALVTLRSARTSAAPAIVLVHAASGTLLPYAPLVEALTTEGAVYGLQATDSRSLSLPQLAQRYLREIEGLGPSLTLVGWSLGGLLAWEMAAQLRETIQPRLILLDTHPLWQEQTQAPAAELAAFALDLGLSQDQLQTMNVPEQWDGQNLVQLMARWAPLPDHLAAWHPDQLQILWDNYRAHLKAVQGYQPPLSLKPVLIAACGSGPSEAAVAWQEAGYTLELQALQGDHHNLLQAPRVAELALLIEAGSFKSPPLVFTDEKLT